jgi:Holliday junction resolvase RusA-like endonuclease
MIYTLDIDPMPKPRMVRSDAWKKRPVVKKYWAFCDEMRLKCSKVPRLDYLDIVFCMPMPESWSQKKKDFNEGKPHKQKPDIDNLVKSVMDALYKDDSGIWMISAKKSWSKNGMIILYTMED